MKMTVDQAKELQQDPRFKAMVEDMNHIIETEKDKMVFAKDEHEMVRCQERVQALRFATRYPEIVVDRESEELEPEPESKIITPGG
jgi:hypothetical protein